MKKKKIILVGILAILAVIGFMIWRMVSVRQKAKAMAESRSQVETVQVTRQNLVDSISVTGTVQSADAWDVSASAKDVKVLQVNYEVGDYVNEGDVILTLDTSDLEINLTQAQNKQALSSYNENKSIETASKDYAEAVEDGSTSYNRASQDEADAREKLDDAEDDEDDAEDRLERREAQLGEAKAALEAAEKPSAPEEPVKPDVTEPTAPEEPVKPDGYDGLAEDDPERLAYDSALEQYEEAKAAYDSEKAAYEEQMTAYQEAKAAYDQQMEAYEADSRAYAELEQTYANASAAYTEAHQAYNSASSAKDQAEDAYEKASEALEDTQKNSDRTIQSAADKLEKAQKEHEYSNDSSQQTIENYQEQIDSCTVKAPISGVITAMNVAVGDTYMGEGSNLFSIADPEHFIVSANVDEYDISSIAKEMEAAVIVEAVGEEELPAKVSFVSPTATTSNMGSASYAIEIALDDANSDLRIGMTAKASIVLEAAYDVLTVPYDCVETDESGNSILYIDKDGERTSVPVEVGMEGDYYVEISGEGLDEHTMVYYSTPMVNRDASESTDEETVQMMPGGGMPGAGMNGGGMPGGGAGGGNRGGGNQGGF